MNTNLIQQYRVFPTNELVPGVPQWTYTLAGGTAQTLRAIQEISEPELSATQPGPAYGFLFWEVNGTLSKDRDVQYTVPNDVESFQATAWYQPLGSGGGGEPTVATYVFSLDQSLIEAGSPIEAVAPSSALSGGSALTGAAAVAITPRPVIAPYGAFHAWFTFVGTPAANGELDVPKGGSGIAIAEYRLTLPDPCASILAPVGLIPVGGPTPAQQQLLDKLVPEYNACAAAHGFGPFTMTKT